MSPACDARAVIRPRHLLVVLLVATAWLLPAAVATALVAVEDVAATAVAVEDGAQLSAADRQQLQASARELNAAGTPVKYVVLKQRPADPQGYAVGLGQRLGYRGDILVLSPGNLAIGSRLPAGTVQEAFESQRAALRRDPVAGTIAVARGLSQARLSGVAPAGGSSGSSGSGSGSSSDDGSGVSGGFVLFLILAVGALIVVGVLTLRRRSRQSAVAKAGPESLDPLVDGLAAQIADLDDDMQVPGPLTQEARPHYDQAVLSYGEARELLEKPKPGVADVTAAGAALEKGLRRPGAPARCWRGARSRRPTASRFSRGCARSTRSTGRPPPRSRSAPRAATAPPCGLRELCGADERGEEPQFREVQQGGRRVPYWQTGPMGMGGGGGFGGGGGGFGPVLGGALAGVILGGMLAAATPRPHRATAAGAAAAATAAAGPAGRRLRRGGDSGGEGTSAAAATSGAGAGTSSPAAARLTAAPAQADRAAPSSASRAALSGSMGRKVSIARLAAVTSSGRRAWR